MRCSFRLRGALYLTRRNWMPSDPRMSKALVKQERQSHCCCFSSDGVSCLSKRWARTSPADMINNSGPAPCPHLVCGQLSGGQTHPMLPWRHYLHIAFVLGDAEFGVATHTLLTESSRALGEASPPASSCCSMQHFMVCAAGHARPVL